MKILLTNDDGIRSPGLLALVRELASDHQLCVSAPDRQRSAAGASMTIRANLYAEPVTFPEFPEAMAFAVSGTPVDCARLGFGCLFPQPDAVISGVNLGPNRGTDVLYSGTCGAAQEAAIHGYPALAMSLDGHHDSPFVHFETAAKLARCGLALLREKPLPFGGYYSINVPDVPLKEVKGVRYGRLGMVLYTTDYERRRDETGRTVYYECGVRIPNGDEYRNTDEYWLSQGYATVTALGFDCAIPLDERAEEEITERLKGHLTL